MLPIPSQLPLSRTFTPNSNSQKTPNPQHQKKTLISDTAGSDPDQQSGGSSAGRSRAKKRREQDDDSEDDKAQEIYSRFTRQLRFYLLANTYPTPEEMIQFIKSVYGDDIDLDSRRFLEAKAKFVDARSTYKSKLLRKMEVSFHPLHFWA